MGMRMKRRGRGVGALGQVIGDEAVGLDRERCEERGDNWPGICSITELTDSVEKWHEKDVLRVVRGDLQKVSGCFGWVERRVGWVEVGMDPGTAERRTRAGHQST